MVSSHVLNFEVFQVGYKIYVIFADALFKRDAGEFLGYLYGR